MPRVRSHHSIGHTLYSPKKTGYRRWNRLAIDDVTHVQVRGRQGFNQIAMKNNRLKPFSGLSAISRPFRVFDMAGGSRLSSRPLRALQPRDPMNLGFQSLHGQSIQWAKYVVWLL
jgi:hypothetical protein